MKRTQPKSRAQAQDLVDAAKDAIDTLTEELTEEQLSIALEGIAKYAVHALASTKGAPAERFTVGGRR